MEKAEKLKEFLPNEFKPYADCLNSFNDVRKSCFGKTLDPDYQCKIDDFKSKFLALNLSVTPKIHSVFRHLPEFLEPYKSGLSRFSEQALESVHHEYNEIWRRYKVSPMSPVYDIKLLQSVTCFNSSNV